MIYKNLVKGQWYKYIRQDGMGVYGRHLMKGAFINTVPGQSFMNLTRKCIVSNSDYHYNISLMTKAEISWLLFCKKNNKEIKLKTYIKYLITIDSYSII